MSKMNLQDSFKKFCEQNGFEENIQQKEIIYLLDKFFNNKDHFGRIFKKNFVLLTWKGGRRQNNATKFCIQ